ncbi:ABC transporter ATP-binding protein [Nocardioides sp.]|uniref:ABC transporter ATP-binding protein n=1 Tax=Nocardioides sp. TaxID=35761 RepID=UPI0039E45E1E
MPESILTLSGVGRSFGGLRAVDDVSLEVQAGHIHAIVGPNGAGKTTLFNMISGFVRADQGTVTFAGRDITRDAVHQRVRHGLVRTFQNIRLFGGLTVLENVLVAQHTHAPSLLSRRAAVERRLRARAEELIDLLELGEYRARLAAGLPYGVQKRLELARAMAANPRLLLLDEPVAGMNEVESRQIMRDILKLRASGVTVLLVEHDMEVVMGASDRITVLNFGKIIAAGTPDDILADRTVREAYLGAEV